MVYLYKDIRIMKTARIREHEVMFEKRAGKMPARVIRAERKREKRNKKQAFRVIPQPKKNYKWLWISGSVLLLLILLIFLIARDNNRISVHRVTMTHAQIPEAFDGYTILQLTDFHGKTFGNMQERLLSLINGLDYDMILLTGDYLSDPSSDDYWVILDVLDGLRKEVPVYYILGESDYLPENADDLDDDWNMCITPKEKTELMLLMEERGAEFVYPIQRIEKDGQYLYLTGVTYYEKAFDAVEFDSDKYFSICVTHRPIQYDVDKRLKHVNEKSLKEVDYDASVSGHTHGGQFRLPLLGAVHVDGKGLFPQEQYAYGLHSAQGRLNFISSGLGADGVFRFRLYNTPEVALITLRCPKAP